MSTFIVNGPMKSFAFREGPGLSAMVMGKTGGRGVEVSGYYDPQVLGSDALEIKFFNPPQTVDFNHAVTARDLEANTGKPSQSYTFGSRATTADVAQFLQTQIKSDLLPPQAAVFVLDAFKVHCHERQALVGGDQKAMDALADNVKQVNNLMIRMTGETSMDSSKSYLERNLTSPVKPVAKADALEALDSLSSAALSQR